MEKWWSWKFSALLGSKFWRLAHEENWLEIFWENVLVLTRILYTKETFLSLPFLVDFANLKFRSLKLQFPVISVMGE